LVARDFKSKGPISVPVGESKPILSSEKSPLELPSGSTSACPLVVRRVEEKMWSTVESDSPETDESSSKSDGKGWLPAVMAISGRLPPSRKPTKTASP